MASAPSGSTPSSTSTALASPSTLALLSLSQDIAALISLSVEASVSFAHDWLRTVLGTIGMGEVVPRPVTRAAHETGQGLAVVVVGAVEPTGQSLTLHLAKSGYTVFPLLPLPSPSSPPTSAALSSVLLSWSAIHKRLRTRCPSHSGAVVPVMTDPEGDEFWSAAKARGRFKHAGETVHAYCAENGLTLVAIVCVPRSEASTAGRGGVQTLAGMPSLPSSPTSFDAPHGNEQHVAASVNDADLDQPTSELPASPDLLPQDRSQHPQPHRPSVDSQVSSHSALAFTSRSRNQALSQTDEHALLSMYRANILDPLNVIRELHDLLSDSARSRRTKGRILFVEGGGAVDDFSAVLAGGVDRDGFIVGGAARMVAAARVEAARLLRLELRRSSIDVCEVAVGPMSPRLHSPLQTRQSLGNGVESAHRLDKMILNQSESQERDPLSYRLRLLARIFAVDEALLYSSVRRAIEDRYPRAKHHAGLVPLIQSLAEITPGSGIIKVLGRWVLGRLFAR